MDVWRPMGNSMFRLIAKTSLPASSAGLYHLELSKPISVLKGDVIGIHSRHGHSAAFAYCDKRVHAEIGSCKHGQYGTSLKRPIKDTSLPVDTMLKVTNPEQRKYAVSASFN